MDSMAVSHPLPRHQVGGREGTPQHHRVVILTDCSRRTVSTPLTAVAASAGTSSTHEALESLYGVGHFEIPHAANSSADFWAKAGLCPCAGNQPLIDKIVHGAAAKLSRRIAQLPGPSWAAAVVMRTLPRSGHQRQATSSRQYAPRWNWQRSSTGDQRSGCHGGLVISTRQESG